MINIEITTASLKALHKFLAAQPLESLEIAQLETEEQGALWDAFGVIKHDTEELLLDEAHEALRA